MKIIRGQYFDGNSIFVIVGTTSFIIIGLLTVNYLFLLLVFVYIPLFTAKDILEIDFENNRIGSYVSFYGESKLLKNEFNTITKLYVNSNRYSKHLRSKGTSSNVKFNLYSGYLKTSEGKKFLIKKSKSKEYVIATMNQLVKKLDLKIEDNTI